jgi:lysozyme
MSIIGCDVSKWQGLINWLILASKARFAIIKLIEGFALDPNGKTNWQQSKGLLPRAGYCFFHPEMDGAEQASRFLSAFGNDFDFGEFGPCVDVEAPTTKNAAGQTVVIPWSAVWITSLRECLNVLEAVTGRVPIIYTGAWFWQPAIGNQAWAARYPLWVASYTQNPIIPKPWEKALIHQYTSSGDGKAYGCQSTGLDLNEFLGTEQEFQTLIGRTEEQAVTSVNVRVGSQTVKVDLPVTISVEAVVDNPVTLDVWKAQFYVGMTPGEVVVGLEKQYSGPALDVNFKDGGPGSPISADNFSAIFTLKHQFTAGTYKVTATSDDGFQYLVDGKVVAGLDGWVEQAASAKTYTGTFTVDAGVHEIVIRYFEKGGLAELHVSAPTPF